MLLDDLLDLLLNVTGNVSGGDGLEESDLLGGEVLTELSLPRGDLIDGNRVKLYHERLSVQVRKIQKQDSTHETVDTSVDDGDLDLHGHGLVLALLCDEVQLDKGNAQRLAVDNVLRSSVRRAPRASKKRVEASRSEPNWAKAATSRY